MVFEPLEIRVLEKTGRSLELEVKGEGHTLLNMLVDFLNRRPDVEYASYVIEHPLVGTPRLLIRTKNRDPVEVLDEALDEIEKLLNTFYLEVEKTLHAKR